MTGNVSETTPMQLKAKVFICYSRADRDFTDRLDAALNERGFEALIDRRDIKASEKWSERIKEMIAQADSVIFVLSPDAVASKTCKDEVAFAVSLNKRIVPIVWRHVGARDVPRELSELNWIFFHDLPLFDERMDQLAKALETASAERKARVFISYSRIDLAFADRIVAELNERGFEPLIDRRDIKAAEKWRDRLKQMITQSDTMVFVISPEAVASEICKEEVEFAASLNKRFVPIVWRHVSAKDVPRELSERNYIFFEDPQPFAERMNKLVEAIETDIEWIRKHTQFSVDAQRWVAAGRPGPGGLMLRPPLLDEAERLIAWPPRGAPDPALLRDFVAVSREAFDEEKAARKVEVDRHLLSQSRFLAAVATQHSEAGDHTTAMALALEALPDDHAGIQRPYASVAGGALFNARLRNREFTPVWSAAKVRSAIFSLDGRYLRIESGGLKTIQDIDTGREVSGDGVAWPKPERQLGWTGSVVILAGAPLHGHEGHVRGVTPSPDGRWIVSASEDGTARVWNAETGEAALILRGHEGNVLHAAFSPDSGRIITTSRDGTARIWNATTGVQELLLPQAGAAVTDGEFSADGRRIVTVSGQTCVWEAEQGQLIAELAGAGMRSAHLSPDGTRVLAECAWENPGFRTMVQHAEVLVWDVGSRKELLRLTLENGTLRAEFSPGGNVLTKTEGNWIQVWDPKSGKMIFEAPGSAFTVGCKYAVITHEHRAEVRDVNTGEVTFILMGHEGTVREAAISPDGSRFLTISWSDMARLWTIEKHRVVLGRDPSVRSGAFSPDGKLVAVGSADGTLQLWNAASGEKLRTLQPPRNWCSSQLSPNGRHVVVPREETAVVMDVEIGEGLVCLSGHRDRVEMAAYSPDGMLIVTASRDRTARIWCAVTGAFLRVLNGHVDIVGTAVFSPDGQFILTTSWDMTARLWDAQTGTKCQVLDQLELGYENRGLSSAKFSPDGTRVVIGFIQDRMARVSRPWKPRTDGYLDALILEGSLEGHPGRVLDAVFSPDGKHVATASDDHTVRIWNVADGSQLLTLNGHTDAVQCIAYASDGASLVTGGNDGTVRIWNASSGAEARVIPARGPVSGVAVSLDGRRIVTICRDRVQVWDAASGREIEIPPPNPNNEIASLAKSRSEICAVAFSGDGKRVLSRAYDNMAYMWDLDSGEEILNRHGSLGHAWHAAFIANSLFVLIASYDYSARMRDTVTGRQMLALRGHTGHVWSVNANVDCSRIVTASCDNTARLWDPQTEREIRIFHGHTGHVWCAAFSADGERIVTGSLDATARIWDAEAGNEVQILRGHSGSVFGACFNADRTLVLTVSVDGTARIWSVASGQELFTLRHQGSATLSACFAPYGRSVLTASDDGSVCVWPMYQGIQDLVDDAKKMLPRALTREQREKAFFDPAPPAWCIEMEKWPYNTQDRKDWLRYRSGNANSPLPDTPEWPSWIASQRPA